MTGMCRFDFKNRSVHRCRVMFAVRNEKRRRPKAGAEESHDRVTQHLLSS
jgi:hypothetical protein